MDIINYLKEYETKDMLRFITCGSVDDGKSTLIGRLLYDSKMIFEDQLSAVETESKRYGTTGDKLDLALLVDGLQSEREQGITIDVAYRFFTTEKRKFIIADTPGHIQYTRNMVTGASTADVAIILIDARKGILTQTRRHSFIVNLLGINHIIVAINKMDLVEFSKDKFDEIKQSYQDLADELGIKNRYYIPISALDGDNIVDRSKNMPWYNNKTLINLLDTMDTLADINKNNSDFRFIVQYVNRPNLDFRGYCGTVLGGDIKVGDEITILPSHKITRVKSIINANNIEEHCTNITTTKAYLNQAITITIADEIDINRGDMIVKNNNQTLPNITTQIKAMIVWFDEKPMHLNKTYEIKRDSTTINANFETIKYKIDINTYKHIKTDRLDLNDIALCDMVFDQEIALDTYSQNKTTGSFIVIDKITNETVGAGMVVDTTKIQSERKEENDVFDIWNIKKKYLEKTKKILWFKERDIVFLQMGKNIGFEQDGKGEEFLRPVLVYKKFNKEQFLGFAMTSKVKEGKYYYTLSKESCVILSQLRTYSAKRIKYISKTIKYNKLKAIHEKFINIVTP